MSVDITQHPGYIELMKWPKEVIIRAMIDKWFILPTKKDLEWHNYRYQSDKALAAMDEACERMNRCTLGGSQEDRMAWLKVNEDYQKASNAMDKADKLWQKWREAYQ